MSELSNITTNCAHCGQELVLKDVDVEGMKAFNLQWALEKNIRCIRCADYLRKVRRLKRGIHNACIRLMVYGRKGGDAAAKAHEDAKRTLAPMLRGFMEATATFYQVPAYWDEQLVDVVLESPELYGTALKNVVVEIKVRSQQELC
jgi:hypothetical protein